MKNDNNTQRAADWRSVKRQKQWWEKFPDISLVFAAFGILKGKRDISLALTQRKQFATFSPILGHFSYQKPTSYKSFFHNKAKKTENRNRNSDRKNFHTTFTSRSRLNCVYFRLTV